MYKKFSKRLQNLFQGLQLVSCSFQLLVHSDAFQLFCFLENIVKSCQRVRYTQNIQLKQSQVFLRCKSGHYY